MILKKTEVVSLRELLDLLDHLGTRMVKDAAKIVVEGTSLRVPENLAKVAVNRGFVERVHEDHRAMRYALTSKGRAELEMMNSGVAAIA